MQHQLNVQHQSISGAFQDLNKLMQQVRTNEFLVCKTKKKKEKERTIIIFSY